MTPELFDRKFDWSVGYRTRPHWAQAGAVVFVTMRLYDSVPAAVLVRWKNERDEWLLQQGIDPQSRDVAMLIERLDRPTREFYSRFLARRIEKYLDSSYGSCFLRDPENARLVANSLHHFDGVRYELGDFVIMPNHVHLLAAFRSEIDMRSSISSWMRYTARQINGRIGRKGALWAPEPFDHLPRSLEKYEQLREYIRDNPARARLAVGEFIYYRRESLDGPHGSGSGKDHFGA